jgi:hypothetical protein
VRAALRRGNPPAEACDLNPADVPLVEEAEAAPAEAPDAAAEVALEAAAAALEVSEPEAVAVTEAAVSELGLGCELSFEDKESQNRKVAPADDPAPVEDEPAVVEAVAATRSVRPLEMDE